VALLWLCGSGPKLPFLRSELFPPNPFGPVPPPFFPATQLSSKGPLPWRFALQFRPPSLSRIRPTLPPSSGLPRRLVQAVLRTRALPRTGGSPATPGVSPPFCSTMAVCCCHAQNPLRSRRFPLAAMLESHGRVLPLFSFSSNSGPPPSLTALFFLGRGTSTCLAINAGTRLPFFLPQTAVPTVSPCGARSKACFYFLRLLFFPPPPSPSPWALLFFAGSGDRLTGALVFDFPVLLFVFSLLRAGSRFFFSPPLGRALVRYGTANPRLHLLFFPPHVFFV